MPCNTFCQQLHSIVNEMLLDANSVFLTITSKDKLKWVPGRNAGCEIVPEWCPQNHSDLQSKYSKASAIPFNQPQPIATTIQDCKTFLMRQSPAYLKVLIHTRSQKRHEEREKWFVVN